MSERSKARLGFDALLARHPTAEIAEVWNQKSDIQETEQRERNWIRYLNRESEPLSEMSGSRSGPWMCVDLVKDGQLLRFAIWLRTGSVYELDEMGAITEDAIITFEKIQNQ